MRGTARDLVEKAVGRSGALDTRADHRDAARMSEEEPKVPSPLASVEAPGAPRGSETRAASPVPGAPPEPVNKVHEWAAAAAIVVFLSIVLAGFVYFFRGTSI